MAKRHYVRKARSYGARVGGKFGGLIPPLVGGFLDQYLSGLNILGFKMPSGVGSAGVGWFMKDPVTMKIGLYQLGGYGATFLTGGSGLGGHIGQVG